MVEGFELVMLNLNNIKNYPAPGRMLSFLLVLIMLWVPGLAIVYLGMFLTHHPDDGITRDRVYRAVTLVGT
jgi:uncharacterized protein